VEQFARGLGTQRAEVHDQIAVVVVDELVLFDDLPKQAFVGRTYESVSRAVDLREELPRKGNECSFANVDEKWRLMAGLASPDGRDLELRRSAECLRTFRLAKMCTHPRPNLGLIPVPLWPPEQSED
jgi:hypothetical protein